MKMSSCPCQSKFTPPFEEPLPLPSAPLVELTANVTLQPPLSRRGTGPGIILITSKDLKPKIDTLDVLPQQKWAEEGYAAVNIKSGGRQSLKTSIDLAIKSLQALETCDIKGKWFVIGRLPSEYWDIFLMGFSIRSFSNPRGEYNHREERQLDRVSVIQWFGHRVKIGIQAPSLPYIWGNSKKAKLNPEFEVLQVRNGKESIIRHPRTSRFWLLSCSTCTYQITDISKAVNRRTILWSRSYLGGAHKLRIWWPFGCEDYGYYGSRAICKSYSYGDQLQHWNVKWGY